MASSLRYWPSSAAIVESSNDAIISTNLDGTVTTRNRAAEAIFGYRPQEVIGRAVFLLAAPGREDETPVILDQIKRGHRIQHYETVRRHKDGRQIAISLTVSPITPIRADNGRIVGASKIARDITERKQAEAELHRLNETLEQRVAERTAELEDLTCRLQAEIVERQRADVRFQELQSELFHAARLNAAGQMAAALAHELNQPLAAAINFVRAAQRQLATGSRDKVVTSSRIMDQAAGEVLRAGQIMRRLRDFVRRGETERRIESIVPMVEEASTLTSITAGASGVRVHLSFDPNAARVFADRIQIQQVLVNLMLNAIDAMADSSRRELEVKTALLDDETTAFTVTDSGTGLVAEIADHLFEPFVSTNPNGMGLGLSICRSIVEAHGGRLRTEPNEGGGTIFCFTLPASPTTGENNGSRTHGPHRGR
jgi:PAS domain S-box-containing protein